jgi:prepilin-type N-terminal cleavage/methylation domain-containing protein
MKKHGFTLLELLVVMVIAAVIVAVALPSFLSMNRDNDIRYTLRSVHSYLSMARQWAITHREATWLEIPPGENTFVVKGDSGNITETNVLPPTVRLLAFSVDTSGNAEIASNIPFSTAGGTGTEKSYTIIVSREDHTMDMEIVKTDTINVNRFTGGIHIQ